MFEDQRDFFFKKCRLFVVLATISILCMLSYNNIYKRNDSPTFQNCKNNFLEEITFMCENTDMNAKTYSSLPPTSVKQGYLYPAAKEGDEQDTEKSSSRNLYEILDIDITILSSENNLTNESPSLNDLIETTSPLALLQISNEIEINPWKICPEPGKGPESTFISAFVAGRLGNMVWSYLSVVATAKLHNLRPVLTSSTIDFLHLYVFNETYLRVPTLEWLDETCQMNGWLLDAYNGNESKVLHSREIFFEELENPPTKGFKMLKYSYFITNTEELVPYWHELKNELILKDELKRGAEMELQRLTKIYTRRSMKVDVKGIEYVGVHVRRTDYIHHMRVVHPGSKVADPKFFENAMNWLVRKLKKPLIFIFVSDDGFWTEENIVKDRLDAFLAGTGNLNNPSLDLALLAACNHTIFPYGTFGLTGAFLASQPGGYTITFDPQNGTVTKEMEFASNLPGWRIMDDDGNINYRDNRISYAYYLHPPIRN